MNIDITISRIYQEDCTIGIFNAIESGFRCHTLELPNLGNKVDISCIPKGVYKYRVIISPNHGKCIEIMNVVGRTLIRIHSGNYTREILGCVLVGDSHKDIDKDGVIDVTNSRNTLRKLINMIPKSGILAIG